MVDTGPKVSQSQADFKVRGGLMQKNSQSETGMISWTCEERLSQVVVGGYVRRPQNQTVRKGSSGLGGWWGPGRGQQAPHHAW